MCWRGVVAAVAGVLALAVAGCGDGGRRGPSPAPTPATLGCRLDAEPAAATSVGRGELLAWPARGSLAGDARLVGRVARAWRSGDREAPDPPAARVLYAERVGDRTVVVLQGRMADGRLTIPVFDATGERPELLGEATLAWPRLAQLSFLLPPEPPLVRVPGERRLRSPRADLLVLAAPEATAAGWLRSVPDAPAPRAMALDRVGGGFVGRRVDVRELVGVQVCAGSRLGWAGRAGDVGPGFGGEPEDEANGGPLSVLDQATTGLVGWQLAARPGVVRPTGPTACVAVRDPLNLAAEPAETCGVEVDRGGPVALGAATLARAPGLLTVAHATALPQAGRVVFQVDGVAVAAPVRRLPGFAGAVFAAAALPTRWARVEAVAYHANGRELGRSAGRSAAGGGLQPDPASPRFVRDRPRLPSCGAAYVGHLGRPDREGRTKLDCFWAALAAGRPAELSVTRPTVEGDPVTTLYRALPGGRGVEVLTDATADRLGSVRWHRTVCDPGPRTPDLSFPGCRAG